MVVVLVEVFEGETTAASFRNYAGTGGAGAGRAPIFDFRGCLYGHNHRHLSFSLIIFPSDAGSMRPRVECIMGFYQITP